MPVTISNNHPFVVWKPSYSDVTSIGACDARCSTTVMLKGNMHYQRTHEPAKTSGRLVSTPLILRSEQRPSFPLPLPQPQSDRCHAPRGRRLRGCSVYSGVRHTRTVSAPWPHVHASLLVSNRFKVLVALGRVPSSIEYRSSEDVLTPGRVLPLPRTYPKRTSS